MPDALRFAFDVCSEGTPVEGAELHILDIPGQATCEQCGQRIEMAEPYGLCACGGILRIVSGEELRVKEMEIA